MLRGCVRIMMQSSGSFAKRARAKRGSKKESFVADGHPLRMPMTVKGGGIYARNEKILCERVRARRTQASYASYAKLPYEAPRLAAYLCLEYHNQHDGGKMAALSKAICASGERSILARGIARWCSRGRNEQSKSSIGYVRKREPSKCLGSP